MPDFYEKETKDLRSRRDNKAFDFPMHIHINPELLYVNRGYLQINYADNKYILNSGDFAIIFPHTVHGYETLSEELDYSLVICGLKTVNSFKNILFESHPENPIILVDALPKDIPGLMNELGVSNDSDFLLNKSMIYLILARILPILKLKPNKDSFYMNSSVKIISYICENYRNNITLDTLEKHLGISKFTVSRFFSSVVKIPFTRYVSLIRIDFAKNLLETTEMGILEIALESGFGSLRTFNRIFKAETGFSPLKYRKNCKVL